MKETRGGRPAARAAAIRKRPDPWSVVDQIAEQAVRLRLAEPDLAKLTGPLFTVLLTPGRPGPRGPA
jgi:hypothetical protein